jgi:hypothetical protein
VDSIRQRLTRTCLSAGVLVAALLLTAGALPDLESVGTPAASAAKKPGACKKRAKPFKRARAARRCRGNQGSGSETEGAGGETGSSPAPQPPPPPPPPPAGCSATVSNGLGGFSAANRPSHCWRPYSDSSPFSTPVASGASVHSSSSSIVQKLLSGGPLSHFVAGDSARDFGMAVYFSSPSDPVYTVDCIEQWGSCALEGIQIRVPAGARPSGLWPLPGGQPWDSHLTIVDQASGWEYDLWDVRQLPSGGGQIRTSWGGKTRIDGNGLGSDAVAAQFGSLAGAVRPQELQAGLIDHALTIDVPCVNGFVAPATKSGLECSAAGMSTSNRLSMGSHIQLNMSTAEINALGLPSWKRAIVVALSKYGAYVADTTGVEDQWSLNFESAAGYTSQGQADPFVSLGQGQGISPVDYNGNGQNEYWFNLATGVDWNRLRVLN